MKKIQSSNITEDEDTLLTTDEVSKMLNLSKMRLYQMRKKGTLKYVKIAGYYIRYRKSDILILQSQRFKVADPTIVNRIKQALNRLIRHIKKGK